MSTSLLAQVRNVAKQAAKSGTGWHVSKDGSIQCKDGRCTLGAILFRKNEPIMRIQEEFDSLMKRAEKLQQGRFLTQMMPGDPVFDYIPSDEKFPDASEAADGLDLDDELTQLVIDANDTSRSQLETIVKNEREDAEESKAQGFITSIYEHEGLVDAQRQLKARIILEEVLLGKKEKRNG